MKRNLFTCALAAALLAISGPAAHAATTCSGVQLAPGADIVSIVNTAPAGTIFCLAPGTYQVTGTISPAAGDTLTGASGAVIDGGRPLSGWQQSGAVWTLSGQPRTPTFAIPGTPPATAAHPEEIVGDDVYLDDAPLDRVGYQYQGKVIGQAVTAVKPGTYFTNYDTGTITLGSSPVGHSVEVAASQRIVKISTDNVTVSGLVIEHGSVLGVAATGSNDVISGNEIRYNHLYGVRTTSTHGTQVVNNSIHDNGILGISGDQDANLLVQGNNIAYNDVAHYDPKSGGCDTAGGSKWTNTTGLVVNANNFHNNYCIGLWLDIDSYGATLSNNQVVSNRMMGIQVEISYQIMISGNTVTGNTTNGISVAESPNVTVTGNTVSGNGTWAIRFGNSLRTDHPSPYGQHVVKNFNAYGNTVVMAGSTQIVGGDDSMSGTPALTPSWNNQYHDNTYIVATALQQSFRWGSRVTYPAWQSMTNDRNSVLTVGLP
jgi:parallel beta-helix repeat protein